MQRYDLKTVLAVIWLSLGLSCGVTCYRTGARTLISEKLGMW